MAERVKYPDNALDNLFEEARRERKWFYARYHDIWFTPDELQRAQSTGQFLWGAANWQLRDPSEFLLVAANKAKAARMEFEEATKRAGAYYSGLQKEEAK